MGWRSRAVEAGQARKAIAEAEAAIRQAEQMKSQGENGLAQGKAMNPGALNWLEYLSNPFKFSEYNAEEIFKGVAYWVLGVAVIGVGGAVAEAAPALNCCVGMSLWAGGFCAVMGMAHSHVGFRS